ncbi:hypothetical protein H9564_05415 [Limosilactobacillus sp. Sa3CUN2]|uniref:Essential protein Yae1 N-terminal domain-containing protein n=1 Tax=Limosilactobacillus avistercoris TaxID=2762243 RepID=A0ABR8PCX2_9LACO|nr:hypothetical protein [Limosilactobacillus avistercoris]MBD7895145.1 hypothetical protein [Limosilactobacillus avistercoris]
MQRSLYEMDMENARNEAVKEGHERDLQQGLQEGPQEGRERGLQEGRKQGLEQGQKEGLQQGLEQGLEQVVQQGSDNERLALVTDLIKSGQSKDQVISFLTNIRKMELTEAEGYYQKAIKAMH